MKPSGANSFYNEPCIEGEKENGRDNTGPVLKQDVFEVFGIHDKAFIQHTGKSRGNCESRRETGCLPGSYRFLLPSDVDA